jgi:hypothetical protein
LDVKAGRNPFPPVKTAVFDISVVHFPEMLPESDGTLLLLNYKCIVDSVK